MADADDSAGDAGDPAAPGRAGHRWRAVRSSRQQRHNNLAEVGGAADSPLLLLGAHSDQVAKGEGATDNASGSATVLALAQRLKARPLAASPRRGRVLGSGGKRPARRQGLRRRWRREARAVRQLRRIRLGRHRLDDDAGCGRAWSPHRSDAPANGLKLSAGETVSAYRSPALPQGRLAGGVLFAGRRRRDRADPRCLRRQEAERSAQGDAGDPQRAAIAWRRSTPQRRFAASTRSRPRCVGGTQPTPAHARRNEDRCPKMASDRSASR